MPQSNDLWRKKSYSRPVYAVFATQRDSGKCSLGFGQSAVLHREYFSDSKITQSDFTCSLGIVYGIGLYKYTYIITILKRNSVFRSLHKSGMHHLALQYIKSLPENDELNDIKYECLSFLGKFDIILF